MGKRKEIVVEEIWFEEPYKLIGFRRKSKAKAYAEANDLEYYRTSAVSEKQASKYMICSDIGYIYSLDSCYYGTAKLALKEAVKTKFFVVSIIS